MASTSANGWRDLSKRNAFFIHLALSLLIFMSLVAVMLTLWFPGKLFFLDGGWQGLKLVALVDVVLGPALTLLLYKPRKPKLAMDMAIIAMIQIAALGYGFVTTYQQRTVAVVFAENNFNTLSNVAYENSKQNLLGHNIQAQTISSLDARKPAVLVTPEPANGFAKYMQDLLNGYPQMHERGDKFVAAKGNFDAIKDKAISNDVLQSEDPGGLVKKALASQRDTSAIAVYRFKARYGSGFALYDHKQAKIVDYINIEALPSTAVAESAE